MAAGSVFLLLVAACAPPPPTALKVIASPTPSSPPSPSPTAPVGVAAPPFHIGEVGLAYPQVTLRPSGGLAPYRWSVVSGALPGGLTLGNDGAISGTPNASGDFAFTIQLADSGDSTVRMDGKISVVPALTATLIAYCAQYCNVELGCVNVCGSFGDASGGMKPYTYSVTGGTVPSGMSLKPDAFFLTGTFQGSPGWVQFTAQVSDALGATASISPKFWMYPHISLQGSATCYGNYNTGCQAQLAISGGVPGSGVSARLLSEAQNPTPNPPGNNPGTCWTLAATQPPPGYGLSAGGGYLTVTIPARLINGYGAVWTVQVASADLCGAGQYCASNDATVTIGVQCG